MKKLFHIVCWLLAANVAFAQADVQVSRKNFQIGEQIRLTYLFDFSEKDGQLSFIPQAGKIVCSRDIKGSVLDAPEEISLEIIGAFRDTIVKSGGKMQWRGTYVVTAWDTGFYVVPPPTIATKDTVYEFPAALLEVSAPKAVQGKDIYDIREQFVELEEEDAGAFWWWIAGGAGLVIAALVFRLLRRKGKNTGIPVRERSLKERTLLAIDALEAAKLWEKDQVKEHYVELSFILRSYLGSRYSLNLLEKTSYQTTVLLIRQGLSQDTVQTIQEILDQADMVKFAGSTPPEIQIFRISALARQIVAETSPIEFEHV